MHRRAATDPASSKSPTHTRCCCRTGKAPRTVLVGHVQEVYFQCSRAVGRADLWNSARHVQRGQLPTAGAMLAALSAYRVGGPEYDQALAERVRTTLY